LPVGFGEDLPDAGGLQDRHPFGQKVVDVAPAALLRDHMVKFYGKVMGEERR